MATVYRYSIYLSPSDLLSFIICNADKYEFSSIRKWMSCCIDIMNHADCVIKGDFYLQKTHSCSKNICGISKKYIMGDTAWILA